MLLSLILKSHILIICFLVPLIISEQGRRNDLLQHRGNETSILMSTKKRTLISTPDSLPNISSDSVHYDSLTQFIVSTESSCHTADVLEEKTGANKSKPPPYCFSTQPHPWVHVFSKSSGNSSLRTQCASIASVDVRSPTVFHRRLRRARKKRLKQDRLLREIVVLSTQVLMSTSLIDSEIIVFDGGDNCTPPIRPPDGVTWRSIPVRDLHIEDEVRGDIGLSFPRIHGTSPFIRLPRDVSLAIIAECGLPIIYSALEACEKLRKVALSRSDKKRVFTDYGKEVTYACVGPQPSRNSQTVHDNPAFMDTLPIHHWRSLVWVMKRAEMSFREMADHSVISNLFHAKKLVPFKTFKSQDNYTSTFSSDFFGGIAFGTNVFLRCHTDADFTMSISQVFLKGRTEYLLTDDVVAYFCFPTLGVAVPLRPGDYFMFNALVSHCISSRCKYGDDIMCASVYLKTAIVGMNNNALPLTQSQSNILDQVRSSNTK